MTIKPRKPLNLPATDSVPKPGDFPLGSPQSRAASRALLERIEQGSEKIRVVIEYIGSPERNRVLLIPHLNAGMVR